MDHHPTPCSLQAASLPTLSEALRQHGYGFVTVTPATHRMVNVRPKNLAQETCAMCSAGAARAEGRTSFLKERNEKLLMVLAAVSQERASTVHESFWFFRSKKPAFCHLPWLGA
jgi:predicted dithiol-disulfide oxidoreductase (DUF899 family)